MVTKEDAERFAEIRGELAELVNEAQKIVQKTDNRVEYERMKGYWLANMRTALGSDHGYVGGCSFTMEDTENFLNDETTEVDEEDDDD